MLDKTLSNTKNGSTLNEFAPDQTAIDMVTTKFHAMKAAYEPYLDIHATLMNHVVDRLTAVIKHYKRANN